MVIRTEEGHEQPDIDTVPGAGGVVNEVISGITHHGQFQFIIAMNDVLPYSIQIVEQPPRVVVDILPG